MRGFDRHNRRQLAARRSCVEAGPEQVNANSKIVIVAFRLWVPVVPGVLVAVVAAIVLSAAAGITDDIDFYPTLEAAVSAFHARSSD